MQQKELKIKNTVWRQVAATIYQKPKDGRIAGTVELDVTDLENYISAQRRNGLKVTFSHFFLAALARGIREVAPEFNTYVRRGNIITRPTIDAAISVLMYQDGQMSSVLIKQADQKNLAEMVIQMTQELNRTKGGQENRSMRGKSFAAAVPWPWRSWLVSAVRIWTMQWGMSLPALGLNPNSFGSFVLTNIGTLGLDVAYPALFPFANVSAVIAIGAVQSKPQVVEGTIVPRRMMQVSASIDHRVVDAQHIGQLFRYLKTAVKQPQQFET